VLGECRGRSMDPFFLDSRQGNGDADELQNVAGGADPLDEVGRVSGSLEVIRRKGAVRVLVRAGFLDVTLNLLVRLEPGPAQRAARLEVRVAGVRQGKQSVGAAARR